ncbi:MAG: exo-alpha-sialidase, partial [Bacteroidetes bacterium]|nr:exo-alpha-sialidase [Bacteroidota bacterium]
DPVNEGSLLYLGKFKKKTYIAFSNTADPKYRDNLTLRISDDEGKTWYKNFVIDKNPNSEKIDFVAYSDLVNLDKKNIGILYEKNNYKEIVFTSQKWR